jgi:hypothetical protein
MRIAWLCLLLAPIPPTHAGVVETAQCKRDLFFAKSSLGDTRSRLDKIENAPLASQCVAWHDHVETASKARAVFSRCLTGPERAETVTEMTESVAGFTDLLKRKCPKL